MARSGVLAVVLALFLLPASVHTQQGHASGPLSPSLKAFLPPNWIAHALANPPVKVYVDAAGSDLVGARLAHQVREGFRRTKGFKLVSSRSDAAVVVTMTTMDPLAQTDSGNQLLAICAYAFVANSPFNSLLYYGELTCTSRTTAIQSERILAMLAHTLRSYR